MQRKWIIPLALCLLLLIAWFFRWERGPTQTDKSLKIIHSKDRWTGQPWVSFYGNMEGSFYSGEMKPIISPQRIDERKSEILAGQEIEHRREELEQVIAHNEKQKNIYATGHNEYERALH